MKNKFFVPIIFIVIAMLSVQSGSSFAKGLFTQLTPFHVVTLRLSLGAVILFIVLRPWRIAHPWNRKSILYIVGYGLTLAGMNSVFYQALALIPVGVAVGLEFIGPLAVAIFTSRQRLDFFWIILAVIGLYILLPVHHELSSINPLGACYALLAGVGWALYIVIGQKAGNYFGVHASSFGTIIASCIVVPISLHLFGSSLFALSSITLGLTVALLSTVIPFSLEMVALTKLPTKTFSILMSMEPAVAALCGFIFLGEHLTSLEWIALMLIIVASVGTTLTIKRQSELTEV